MGETEITTIPGIHVYYFEAECFREKSVKATSELYSALFIRANRLPRKRKKKEKEEARS